ncbi:MAG: YbjQ family protein, partial [Myxococcales bacterium]|nr:YbjQ family protein [Myxococcales bacterium]
MMVVTTETVHGHRIQRVLGLVRGNTVRTRNVGQDFLASLRNLVGGEVTQYTAMLSQSREQALDRMRAEALALGANAV